MNRNEYKKGGINMLLGYARVSTKEQNEARQVKALIEHGVDEANIFIDKASGKSFKRQEYQTMLKVARAGDTIVITSLDRFGRNYDEVREQFKRITNKGININVIDMPILNTDQVIEGNLTMQFISDVVLSVLGYVAEQERQNIRTRQAEGIKRAKERKVKFGRPDKQEKAKEVKMILKTYQEQGKTITIQEACNMVGISRRAYYNYT